MFQILLELLVLLELESFQPWNVLKFGQAGITHFRFGHGTNSSSFMYSKQNMNVEYF